MNTKVKTIFSAAFAAAVLGAMTATAAAPPPAAAVPPSATAATGTATNALPSDLMAKLFGDPVIAKGSGVEVKRSQLDAEVLRVKTSYAVQGRTIPPEAVTSSVEPQVLNALIVRQLVLAKSAAADKAQGKADFDKAIQQKKTEGKLTDAEFDQRLNQQLKLLNITPDDWKADQIGQATMLVVLKRELNIAVTDADARNFYNSNSADFQVPEEVHVRHILLLTMDPATRTPLTDDQAKAKRKQVDEILKRARGGEDFAKLAGQYSEDTQTKDNGGELPPFARAKDDPQHAMVPEFETAAFSLATNQISDVITTQYGYHIIQLLGKTPAVKLQFTDKLPASEVTVNENIKNFLERQKLSDLAPDYLKKLNKDAGVEILDPVLKQALAEDTATPPATPPAMPAK
jgi:parvulin-like peptidyl-prolyl isomerase